MFVSSPASACFSPATAIAVAQAATPEQAIREIEDHDDFETA
jgi:hypothetical protein